MRSSAKVLEGPAVNANVTDGEIASAFNLRADFPGVASSTILMGVYADGRIRRLGKNTRAWASKFNAMLDEFGIGFHCDRGNESYWY